MWGQGGEALRHLRAGNDAEGRGGVGLTDCDRSGVSSGEKGLVSGSSDWLTVVLFIPGVNWICRLAGGRDSYELSLEPDGLRCSGAIQRGTSGHAWLTQGFGDQKNSKN